MLTKLTCFLLLFAFIFLVISHLFDLLVTLWIVNKSSTLLSSSGSAANFGLDQLKLILGFRGIYYVKRLSGGETDDVVQEKLAELVATSGEITRDELIQLNLVQASDTQKRPQQYNQLKVFGSAKLMEEEIDDNNVWLLYVSQNEDPEPKVWSEMVRQFGKFDLRFARFDCSADRMYCHRRRWHSQRIVLVYPRNRFEQGKRIYNYPLESSTQSTDVILWLQSQLSSQLSYIVDINDTFQLEPGTTTNPNLVKMVAIMGEQFRQSPPLSLSLLALRFRDRVSFGVHFATPKKLSELHSSLKTNIDPRLPIYLISHRHQPDHLIIYNANNYDPLSYIQVDAYLRGLILDATDICLALFSLINLYLGLDFFWTRCMTARKHLRLCAVKTVEVNFILTCISLAGPLLVNRIGALLSLALPQSLTGAVLDKATRWTQSIWSSTLAFQFRSQLLSPFGFERFCIALVITGCVLVTIRRNCLSQMRLFNDYDDELIKSVFYWASLIGCFVGFVLFRKTRPIRRRHHADAQQTSTQVNETQSEEWLEDEEDELELEEHIDLDSDLDRLLIESMFSGMPNLWLQPELISTDYIHQLPVWQFIQEETPPTTIEESSTSSSTDSSDNEESVSQNVANACVPQSTVSEPHASCSNVQEPERCKSSKEAPECSLKLAAESCIKSTPKEQMSPHLRAKLEEKKRKIIRIRKKRSKRPNSEVTLEKELNVTQQQHQQQPDLEWHRPKWMLDFNDCTICLDAYRHTQTICGLPCGHNYHNLCIGQWLGRGNHCCPICRWPTYRLKHPRQAQCN